MKRVIFLTAVLLAAAGQAIAEPGAGVRAGTINDGYLIEGFTRLTPCAACLVEISAGFGERDTTINNMPVTANYGQGSAILAAAGKSDAGMIYGGPGWQLFKDENAGSRGSVVAQAGAELNAGKEWAFILDYRHSFEQSLNSWLFGFRRIF